MCYEVARLYTDGAFRASLDQAFEGDVKLRFHLAPPLLARRDKATGHLRKRAFGGWMLPLLRLLSKGRRLRGTVFDPFGHTAERRMERALIAEYEALVEALLASLSRDSYANAVHIAGMILEVRGFGHVKEQAVAKYRPMLAAALAEYPRGASTPDLELRRAG
ncbi:MAG: DUF6537 domain-containing protein [Pseudomonadota bacterium]|nr:DUF6537 domain-containing protein [Pseudomonadota bacterium]